MRRIIAEDPNWNLSSVPPLLQLCFNALVTTFESEHSEGGRYHKEPVLSQLSPEFQERLVSNLPIDLPLPLTAGIEHDAYWKRKVQAVERWRPCVVAEHGAIWKRMFFERLLREKLEAVAPEREDEEMGKAGGILELAQMAAPYVKVLDLHQMLPPDDGEPEEPVLLPPEDDFEAEVGAYDGGDDDGGAPTDHIDLIPVLRALKVSDLRVCYTVKNCGMKFKWSMFGMTSGDCTTLMRGIRDYVPSLTSLSLHGSLIGDAKARMMCKYLLGNKSLTRLDLSHNAISDAGARAIAKLVNNSVLEEVDLRDNKIAAAGAKQLGRALRGNTTLHSLNVRLNRFKDGGGRDFFRGICGNTTLRELNVSCNSLGTDTAEVLCQYVDRNPSLGLLDISCNELGEQAGRLLLEALAGNTVLKGIDLRLCHFDKDTEFQINVILKCNAKR